MTVAPLIVSDTSWTSIMTAIGTVAVAVVALAVALFAEWRAGVRVRDEREHSAEALAKQQELHDKEIAEERALADKRLAEERRAALQARQWLDADVIADVQRMLIDINPERRGINLNPDKAIESAKSAALDERANQVDRELLRLAAGHPDTAVQRSAHDLSGALVRAAYATEWYIRDVVARRDSAEVLAEAQRAYAEAMDAAEKLAQAVKQAGSR